LQQKLLLIQISQTSSFNSTLSKVESPVKIDIDLGILASQASISSSLQNSIDEAAKEAVIAEGD
jgi:hypothetical protein